MKQTMKTFVATLIMTGTTAIMMAQTPVKATFVEGSDKGRRESADKVADGKKFTKWCLDAPQKMPYYVILSVDEPIALGEYILTTGDDTNEYPERNPCSWLVYGSNDQKDWKLVAEQHSCLRMGDLNEQDYYFTTKNQKPFRYFKFVFQEMQEGTRIQLSEIALIKARE